MHACMRVDAPYMYIHDPQFGNNAWCFPLPEFRLAPTGPQPDPRPSKYIRPQHSVLSSDVWSSESEKANSKHTVFSTFFRNLADPGLAPTGSSAGKSSIPQISEKVENAVCLLFFRVCSQNTPQRKPTNKRKPKRKCPREWKPQRKSRVSGKETRPEIQTAVETEGKSKVETQTERNEVRSGSASNPLLPKVGITNVQVTSQRFQEDIPCKPQTLKTLSALVKSEVLKTQCVFPIDLKGDRM